MNDVDLRSYISAKFAVQVGLPEDVLFGENLSLAEIVTRSDKLRNSVDLMEAFAKTANALRKEKGLRVKLPTLPLDAPISKVLDVFMDEARATAERANSAGA